MLQARALSYSRNNEMLFEDLDFTIYPGQHVAVAGRNGVGKSTLFDLILHKLSPETGDIERPRSWRVASMQQEVVVTDRPAVEYVLDGHVQLRAVEQRIEALQQQDQPDPELLANCHTQYADLGGYEAHALAATILHGLGFSNTDMDKPYAEFSGGWRIRLNLAQALLQPADLLLLDEPTNHLDLEAIMWLEQWLARFEGTLLLIAHDRSFLDNATQHTLYLSGGSGKLYAGNYSSCERQRAEQLMQAKASQAKVAAQSAHMQKFIDRFRAKASKAKQVQSRIKALEKLQASPSLHIESPYQIGFNNPHKVSNPLFALQGVDLGYNNQPVLHQVSQTILPGARIGVLGENGAGKSTLLKALVGELDPLAGELGQGRHAHTGYFAQHQLETLVAQNTALASYSALHPELTEQQCRDYLGGWGFNAQMLQRPIATLSGGEKARYVLATLAAQTPAVLVLDEPTNHLDLDMRDALVMALHDYVGAVVIVSHDRNLLRQTVDECWVVGAATVTRYTGDIDDYTNIILSQTDSTGTPTEQAASSDGASRKEQRQARAKQREAERDVRTQLTKVERDLANFTDTLKDLESQLANPEIYNTLPADELDALLARAGRYRHRVEQAEEQWLALSEQLEQMRQPAPQ